MAVIGPRFTNGINVDALRDAGVNWGKQIRADYDQSRRDMYEGMKALGTSFNKARQMEEAEKIQKDLQDKLQALLDAKAAKQGELDNTNALRDEAKGTVSGIDTMLAGYNSALDPNSFNIAQRLYGRKAGL